MFLVYWPFNSTIKAFIFVRGYAIPTESFHRRILIIVKLQSQATIPGGGMGYP